MAANRYGRIYHSDHHSINLRFPSADARREFADKFEKYHAGHDHDGEVPRFEDTAASVIGNPESNTIHDAHSVNIDGYATYEIEAYHNPNTWNSYDRGRYRPPTCCVPSVISINRTFINSSTLTRHELSAIFMDMPEEDFQNLLKSVETEGFKDPVIRMIDAQVLDGWHRYRAAKELNLLRKLRFQQWKEEDEGDPATFVYARNMERRHHPKSVRAQIAVRFYEKYGRFGHGGDRKSDESSHQNDDLKTRQEIAKETGVSTSTVDRATTIERIGRADEVISGEKTASQIIKEETVKSLWEQITPAISAWKKEREGVGYASKGMFLKATLRFMGLPSDTEASLDVLKSLLELLTSKETNVLEDLVRKQLEGNSLWGNASLDTSEQQETEYPTQTAEEREVNKELKRKKQVCKSLWDTRIQAGRDYVGTGDTDLNQYLSLPELEKGFAKNNPAYAAAYESAMSRTSLSSFHIVLEKVLESDVDIDVLEREFRALQTYAGDLRNWQRSDWSPDTNWILPLIAAKKAKVAATEKPEPDMNALWDAFNKRYPKWKAKYAETGYKENDLIQASTEGELFDALRVYRDSDRTGPVTAEEIQDVTDLMKCQSYPFARRVRDLLREKRKSEDDGFAEIDRYYDRNQRTVLRSLVSPLLGRLGADDMSFDYKRSLIEDLYDVFLEYENAPTDKEMVIALLDLVDSILSDDIE